MKAIYINWTLFAIIMILQALDAWTTNQALLTDSHVELNKPPAMLMAIIGIVPALILAKVAMLGVLGYLIQYAHTDYPDANLVVLSVALGVIAAGYVVVVIYNYRLISKG